MEREGAAGREGSEPASPSQTAFFFTSLQVCLLKGERLGDPGHFEKRNHLAVGDKNQELFCAGSSLAGQSELKGLLSSRKAPSSANTPF